MKELLKKFTSRKFIMALLGVVTGIATALSNLGGEVGTIAGLIVTVASVVTYIYTEGKIDAENKQLAIDIKKLTDEVIDIIKNTPKGEK